MIDVQNVKVTSIDISVGNLWMLGVKSVIASFFVCICFAIPIVAIYFGFINS